MLVKFGENDIKTVEDLAGCATDDLVGWTERKEGSEPTKHPGILDATKSRATTPENMIMQARVIAGWITEAESRQTGRTDRRPRRSAGLRSDVARMLALADPDLDNGPRTEKSATTRMCAVTRQNTADRRADPVVLSPQGEVVADVKRKLPGRGLWLSASHRVVAEAIRRNQFGKASSATSAWRRRLSPIPKPCWCAARSRRSPSPPRPVRLVSGFGKVEDALTQARGPVKGSTQGLG